MADFCKECAAKCLGFTEDELKRAVMTDYPDLCEGCGQMRPVVIRIKPTLAERWDNLGHRLRDKIEKKS